MREGGRGDRCGPSVVEVLMNNALIEGPVDRSVISIDQRSEEDEEKVAKTFNIRGKTDEKKTGIRVHSPSTLWLLFVVFFFA